VDVAVVDLSASTGRVLLSRVRPDRLGLAEVHRFPNQPVTTNGRLRWDIESLYAQTLTGLRLALDASPQLAGIGIDSWTVDYGLLDAEGELIEDPVHYLDRRTDGVLERLHREVAPAELYAVTGLQQLAFNTLVQLVSERSTPDFQRARTVLLVPDLLTYWLTGTISAERSNASTTQLYDVSARDWATVLLDRLRIPRRLLAPLRDPGTIAGGLRPEVAADIGAPEDLPVVTVASDDTASAVVALPVQGPDFAFVSSGTWSLVGVEIEAPVLTEEARLAGFSNEAGLDGSIRFVRNVMGLWLLQECLRTWNCGVEHVDLRQLLQQAAVVPSLTRVVDADHPAFLAPGGQPARIYAQLAATGQPLPSTPAETARTVLDSLALAHRRAVRAAERLTGVAVATVHVIGIGARNPLLCQLTADACGVPVVAGPVDAAALGNALVQARTLGGVSGDRGSLRELVRDTQPTYRYEPSGRLSAWDAAEQRLGLI
jgi:rhamnulokinase